MVIQRTIADIIYLVYSNQPTDTYEDKPQDDGIPNKAEGQCAKFSFRGYFFFLVYKLNSCGNLQAFVGSCTMCHFENMLEVRQER